MAYRNDIGTRDRGAAIAAVVAIHAALLFVFLNLSGKIDLRDPQSALRVFNLNMLPPPPPPPQRVERPQPKNSHGGSAPKNIKSEATPIAEPKPEVRTPPVSQIPASQMPRARGDSTQGSSNVAGPGTGAGGWGSGSGDGNGSGSGDGGAVEPPHLTTSVLTGRDFPRGLLDQWPGRATVFLRLRIDARGGVAECTVDRGTGNSGIDGEVCRLAHDRLHFRPALNRSGQAVAGWFGYAQPAPR